ncbi:MAG TPA: hypothetical protein VFT74_01870, partial [Isosphaeraceae bacterium]|nr:hypothetical protein [Isosphaeraceae bacterium]
AEAVALYLARLDVLIRRHPADAVAHLTWPCYLDDPPVCTPPAATLHAPTPPPVPRISETIR